MIRTIEVRGGDVYYKGKLIDYVAKIVAKHFGLVHSTEHKYVITVTESENGPYRICYACQPERYYELWKDGDDREYCGQICIEHLSKLFPIIKIGPKYNITVKKVLK